MQTREAPPLDTVKLLQVVKELTTTVASERHRMIELIDIHQQTIKDKEKLKKENDDLTSQLASARSENERLEEKNKALQAELTKLQQKAIPTPAAGDAKSIELREFAKPEIKAVQDPGEVTLTLQEFKTILVKYKSTTTSLITRFKPIRSTEMTNLSSLERDPITKEMVRNALQSKSKSSSKRLALFDNGLQGPGKMKATDFISLELREAFLQKELQQSKAKL